MSGLDLYQALARAKAVYPGQGEALGLYYAALGLAGEAGEVAGKVSKVIRDGEGELTPEWREAILDELGDTLWYVGQVAAELGAALSGVAEANLSKLADRARRGVLKGDGDGR